MIPSLEEAAIIVRQKGADFLEKCGRSPNSVVLPDSWKGITAPTRQGELTLSGVHHFLTLKVSFSAHIDQPEVGVTQ